MRLNPDMLCIIHTHPQLYYESISRSLSVCDENIVVHCIALLTTALIALCSVSTEAIWLSPNIEQIYRMKPSTRHKQRKNRG